jgi:hypothetical protein
MPVDLKPDAEVILTKWQLASSRLFREELGVPIMIQMPAEIPTMIVATRKFAVASSLVCRPYMTSRAKRSNKLKPELIQAKAMLLTMFHCIICNQLRSSSRCHMLAKYVLPCSLLKYCGRVVAVQGAKMGTWSMKESLEVLDGHETRNSNV